MQNQAVHSPTLRLHKYVTDFKPNVSYGWVLMLRFRVIMADLRARSAK